jgi:ATP-dependent DNA helicase RecG
MADFYQDVDELLDGGMGPRLHWFPEETPVSKLAAVMAGMANGSGGVVLLGVAPRSGVVHGIQNPQEAQDRVFQAALLCDPPLVLPIPRLVQSSHGEESSQGEVLWISVPAGLPHVYNLEGRYLGRENTQTNPLSPRRLRQLLMERGVIQLESQVPPGATLADLDEVKVIHYVDSLQLPSEMLQDGAAASPAAWQQVLLRRGCLKPAGVALSPTYAGLLLFGRFPQQWLPNAAILAVRFAGNNLGDRFLKQEIGGTLPEQLYQAEAFFHSNIRKVVRLDGLAHAEKPEYPADAVRELLVNAVAHRDYNVGGDSIHLRLFADRLEIQSPGGLPGPVTLDNLLEARFSRNAVIAQVLADMGFVERLGYGLNRVVSLVHQEGLRPPRFDETGGAFRVTIWGEALEAPTTLDLPPAIQEGLNPRQQQALAFLARHKRITNRDYQDLCPDVHPETLRRDLSDLVEHKFLLKIGDKKSTYYILK